MRRNGELSPNFPLLSRIGRTRKIKAVICDHYEISLEDLMGPSRVMGFSWPRQVAMWVIRKRTGRAYALIAADVGRTDHTTVISAVARVEKMRIAHQEIADDLEIIGAAVDEALSDTGGEA